MVEYSKLVTTEKGQALMIKMLTREEKIKYTKICASNEKYNEGQLESLTTLDDIRQTGVVSKLTQVDEITIKVETAFTNTGLDDGYYMRTLGLYALDPNIGEILYAVCIASDDNCYMPPDNGKASTGVYINMYQRVEIADNVLLNVDSGVFATIGDIQELTQLLNSHTENTDNPHNVTKQQLGLGDVDNTSDLNKPVSVPVQEALDAYYAQLTAYTDKEIADLIDGAPTTLDTLKELADAISDNKSIQEALDAAIGTKANQNEFDSHMETVASSTAYGHVKVDDAFSSTSENPVQNKVVDGFRNNVANNLGKYQLLGFTNINLSSGGTMVNGGVATCATGFNKISGATTFLPVLRGTSYCISSQPNIITEDDGSLTLSAVLINVSGATHTLTAYYSVMQFKTKGTI